MYSESDLLPLSALQHLVFCERQCALIHLDRVWTENVLTARGRTEHEKVHDGSQEIRSDTQTTRGLSLRSLRLGVSGKADVVEFRRLPDGSRLPYPVEHKHGKPKPDMCDKVQLCAQAMCLEEMLHVRVTEGAIFYGKTRRRLNVCFDEGLRGMTESAAQRLHDLIDNRIMPPPIYGKKCKNCSLLSECMPELSSRRTVARYVKDSIREYDTGEGVVE